MEKEFIEYIEALALKDLGFDEPCLAFYNGKFLQSTDYDFDEGISRDIGLCCKTPTYSQAFRWFREKHQLNGFVCPVYTKEINYVQEVFQYSYFIVDKELNKIPVVSTYEEAELACLIKLIEIVKEKLNEKD